MRRIKILFISEGNYPDYQHDMLFHGLMNLKCVDLYHTAELPFMFGDYPIKKKSNLYGKGFTLYCLLQPEKRALIDIDDAMMKIKSRFFDIVIYGSIRRCDNLISKIQKYFAPEKVLFIDGEDDQKIDKALLKLGVYFKRELTSKVFSSGVFPIQFGIPSEKIVKNIPAKFNKWATVLPGKPQTYIFNNESEYYFDYGKSRYGVTTKKAGWDCLRHYEIIASGCIPYFAEIDSCPDPTMFYFPKDVISFVAKQVRRRELSKEAYTMISGYLIDYASCHLTTKAVASRTLSIGGFSSHSF